VKSVTRVIDSVALAARRSSSLLFAYFTADLDNGVKGEASLDVASNRLSPSTNSVTLYTEASLVVLICHYVTRHLFSVKFSLHGK
jgi:hypothetical protein